MILLLIPDLGAFAETPMDGATRFTNFPADVPWEDPAPQMMEEVNALLKLSWVTRVSHFSQLDVKNTSLKKGAICLLERPWASFKKPSGISSSSMAAMTNMSV